MSEYKFEPDPNDHALIAFLQEQESQEKGVKRKEPTTKAGAEHTLITRLVQARLSKKCTQTMLAQKAGIPQSALARIEAGKVNPTLKTVTKLAEALDMQLTLLRRQG